MKKRVSIFGAATGFLWGLLAVFLSDGTSSSAWGDLAIRAVVVCIFVALGAAAGLVAGWVVGLFIRKR